MDSDLDFFENGIVERLDMKPLAFGVNKYIRGPIVWLRGLNEIVSGRDSDHDIAPLFFQGSIHRVPDESSPLSPPDIAERRSHFTRKQCGNLVFESFQLPVGERKVIGI